MDHTRVIADLQAELETQIHRTATLEAALQKQACDLSEIRQRLELRNLSLERLQSQFTVAADAVQNLLTEREILRQSRWVKLGVAFGFLPKLKDELE